MKFTHVEYEHLLYYADKSFKLDHDDAVNEVYFNFYIEREIWEKIRKYDLIYVVTALLNPLTREWAHDKFVEKEKKYYWNSIKTDLSGNHMRLFRHENSGVSTYSRLEPSNNINEDEQLTESEIKSWGFNPEMFDREEV